MASPSDLDEITRVVLSWAKRAALAERRSRLGVADILCGLFAIDRDGSAPPEVREALKAPSGEIAWPEEVRRLYRAAEGVAPTEEKFPFDNELRAVIERSFLEDRALSAVTLAQNLRKQGSELVTRMLVPAGGGGPIVSRLDDVLKRTKRLQERLARRVLGQEPAIAMLGDAYFLACIGAAGAGPRGIFTFLGPPGVGKTLLAETFAQELREV